MSIFPLYIIMCLYYWTLDDGRLTYKKEILNNVAHQKENSFGSKEKSSKRLKAVKKDAVELPLSAHYYYYYRLSVFVFAPFWAADRAGYLFVPKAVFFSFRLRLN